MFYKVANRRTIPLIRGTMRPSSGAKSVLELRFVPRRLGRERAVLMGLQARGVKVTSDVVGVTIASRSAQALVRPIRSRQPIGAIRWLLVASHQQRLGALQVLWLGERDLKVACSEVAQLRHITREARLRLDRARVHLDEDQDFGPERPELRASKVLDALEGDVEARRRSEATVERLRPRQGAVLPPPPPVPCPFDRRQCSRVGAGLCCSRKKRTISRLASGPRGSV